MMSDLSHEWRPLQYVKPNPNAKYALLVLNQPIENDHVLRNLWENAWKTVAADGGANRLASVLSRGFSHMTLDAIVGDLDSLTSETRNCFRSGETEIVKVEDQNNTDFTKAYRYIKELDEGVDVVVLGGLGGRVDQGVATLNHLYTFHTSATYEQGRVVLVTSESVVFVLKKAKHVIHVREAGSEVLGDYIGVMPKTRAKITTKGLKWDMDGMINEWGGFMSTSNQVKADMVEVECDDDCVFTIDYRLNGND